MSWCLNTPADPWPMQPQWTPSARANSPQCSCSHINCKTCPRVRLQSHPKLEVEQMFIPRKQCPHGISSSTVCRTTQLHHVCASSSSSSFSHLQASPPLFLYSLNSFYYSRFGKDTPSANSQSTAFCPWSPAEPL